MASDYGIVSFAFIFINFMGNFADFGIGSALIQRKELDESALYTAFTLKCILGGAALVLTFALSALAPLFFDNPQIVVIIRLLSLYFLITIISFLPISLLTKAMDFKKISIAEITLSLVNSLLAIILALSGYGYWSIVVAFLCANVVSSAMLYIFKPVALRLRLDGKIVREFVSFGGYLFLSGLLVFFTFNLDNFVIGTINGSNDLGYYAIAYNWGSMVCVIMYMVVLRVVFPLMVKLQDEGSQIRNAYLKTVEYSGYLVILVNILLYSVSKEFLVCILGQNTDKWLPALTSLRILCFYGILRGLLEPIGQVIIAKGDTKILFKANIVATLFEAATVYPALKYYGIEGVASIVTIAYLLQYLIFYSYLKNQLQIRIADIAKAVWPSLCAALPMVILYPFIAEYQEGSVVLFLAKASAMAALYVVTLGILTRWELFKLVGGLLASSKSA